MTDSVILDVPPRRRHPVRQGLDAARANLAPGAVIWIVGLAILLGYYFHPPTHAALEWVAQWKRDYGLVFSTISTAIFGGLLPVLIQQVVPNLAHRASLRHLPFYLLFWAYRGVEIDLFYRLQGWWFGNEVTPGVVIPKVVLDQFVFSPLWFVPVMTVGYLWKDCGFSFRETRRQLGPRWYRERAVPILISNGGVWLPAVAILYSLPPALQMPFQNLILCLWVLILMFVTAANGRQTA